MTSILNYEAISSSDEEVAETVSNADELALHPDTEASRETLATRDSEATASGSQAPAFLEVDYSKTRTTVECQSLEDMPRMKVYRVKRKEGSQDISIVKIYKNQLKEVINLLT